LTLGVAFRSFPTNQTLRNLGGGRRKGERRGKEKGEEEEEEEK